MKGSQGHGRAYQENGGRPSSQQQQSHSRQHSEPSNRLVPIRVKKPGNFFEAMTNRSSQAAVPQYSGGTMPRSGGAGYGWGNSRLGTANNFSSDANISRLSTFSSARGGLPMPPEQQYRNGGNDPRGVVNPGMKLSPSTPILLSPGKESDSAA